MSADSIREVRARLEDLEDVDMAGIETAAPNDAPKSPDAKTRDNPPEVAPDPEHVPAAFPVRPLGQAGGTFYFLSARGEMVGLSASSLDKRPNLMALFAGCAEPISWLRWIGPSKRARSDDSFNPSTAADYLIQASSALPLFDPSTQIRHFGTWRGDGNTPIAHIGERIVAAGGAVSAAGRTIGGHIYPATHSRASPAAHGCEPGELGSLRDEISEMWTWGRPTDADVVMGWIGQAALGQFPRWRAHMWIKGRLGSGKSTLVRIIDQLLGGMSAGVKKGSSEAAVRQSTNRMALARIFDEAESEGDQGKTEAIVALFRLMSDADGAQVERGTADHAGINFRLYGAGLMASIIPGIMTPADRSRFVMLDLGKRPVPLDPLEASERLARLESDAAFYGAHVWRRMLDEAAMRWDDALRRYSALVQTMGGESRAGDTIGAILAGWDLMLHDGPPTEERLERAKEIAAPLLEDAADAQTEGEGERCLRTILAYLMPKDHGGVVPISELVLALQNDEFEPNKHDNKLLGRVGLRVLDGSPGQRELFVLNGAHPILDRALQGTRWRGGGHRAALMMLEGVQPAQRPVRVAGQKPRGMTIPACHLPGGSE